MAAGLIPNLRGRRPATLVGWRGGLPPKPAARNRIGVVVLVRGRLRKAVAAEDTDGAASAATIATVVVDAFTELVFWGTDQGDALGHGTGPFCRRVPKI